MTLNDSNKFIVGAFFGALVGGVATLLFAPKSGRDLRTDIQEEIDEVEAHIAYYGQRLAQYSQSAMDTAQTTVHDAKRQVKQQVNDVKKEISHNWDDLKENVSDKATHAKHEAELMGEAVTHFKDHTIQVAKEQTEALRETIEKHRDQEITIP